MHALVVTATSEALRHEHLRAPGTADCATNVRLDDLGRWSSKETAPAVIFPKRHFLSSERELVNAAALGGQILYESPIGAPQG